MAPQKSKARAAEQNIGRLTLWLGGAATLAAWAFFSPRAAAGVAVGALLAWVNHRWLGQSLDAVTRAAGAQGEALFGHVDTRVPRWTYFKFIARYGLIGVVLYVMFSRLHVPVVAMLSGLLMLGAAAIAQGIREAVSRRH
ncbi:MAG: ATP synthase subunit I [Candidatus Acidiferrales bacterium]